MKESSTVLHSASGHKVNADTRQSEAAEKRRAYLSSWLWRVRRLSREYRERGRGSGLRAGGKMKSKCAIWKWQPKSREGEGDEEEDEKRGVDPGEAPVEEHLGLGQRATPA